MERVVQLRHGCPCRFYEENNGVFATGEFPSISVRFFIARLCHSLQRGVAFSLQDLSQQRGVASVTHHHPDAERFSFHPICSIVEFVIFQYHDSPP
jgi:hypothetical protein